MVENPALGRGRGTRVGVVTREVAGLFGIGLAALFWVVGDAPEDTRAAAGLVREWRAHAVGVRSLQFAPDGRSLVSSGGDGRVAHWTVPGGAPTRAPLSFGDGERVARLSHDGRTLAVATPGGGVRVWRGARDPNNVSDDRGTPLSGIRGQIHTIEFTPDDRVLALGAIDGSLVLWDCPGQKVLGRWRDHSDCLHTLAISPDGRTIATGGTDRRVRLHDAILGASVELPMTIPHPIQHVAFSPDGKILAAAGRNTSTLTLWDVATRRIIAEPHGPEFCTSALAFTPDGRHLLAAGAGREIFALSTQSWERRHTIPALSAWTSSLAITPDGRHLAVGSSDGHIRLWDLNILLNLDGFTPAQGPSNPISETKPIPHNSLP